jgi:hypothetical protein
MDQVIRRAICALPAVAMAAFVTTALAGPPKEIVGVWKLVSNTNTTDGKPMPGSFGPNPSGMLILTGSGYFTSMNANPDLPKFKSNNRQQGTAEENAAVVKGSNGLYGTYTVSADGKTLTYKVSGSSWAAWNGQDLKRELVLKGDEMTQTFEASRGGRSVLKWKKVSGV